jgi:hypothetical protein
MDADERQIFDFLSSYGEEWVNAKEVCRKAGGKHRFNDDNNWAWPVLQRMKDRQVIEGDQLGRYRVKPKKHKGRWVSPDIEKILEENGVAVDPEPAAPADEDQPEQP